MLQLFESNMKFKALVNILRLSKNKSFKTQTVIELLEERKNCFFPALIFQLGAAP